MRNIITFFIFQLVKMIHHFTHVHSNKQDDIDYKLPSDLKIMKTLQYIKEIILWQEYKTVNKVNPE